MAERGHYLEMETFLLCINDVSLVRKVNLERYVPETGLPSPEVSQANVLRWLPGLEITLRAGAKIEVDYLRETHRDQVYTAIWSMVKEIAG